jgi:hypothetical protein
VPKYSYVRGVIILMLNGLERKDHGHFKTMKGAVEYGVLLIASQFHGVEVERAKPRYWKREF